VSPSKSREVLVFLSELGETLDDNGKFGKDDVAGVAEEDEISVVGNVAGGGAEVDDGGGSRGVKTEDVNVGHNVVATLLLLDGGLLHLSVVEILFHRRGSAGVEKMLIQERRRTRLAFICSRALSEMLRPSCFSAVARLSQSLRQVPKRVCTSS
jgi:hypothetical protein